MQLPFDPDHPTWGYPARIAPMLHEAGRTLRGRNLGLGAWREIATGIATFRTSKEDAARRILALLEAAKCRADATRALLKVRQFRAPAKGRSGGRRGPRPAVSFERIQEPPETGRIPLESPGWEALTRLEHDLAHFRRPTQQKTAITKLGLKAWTPVGALVSAELQRVAHHSSARGGASLAPIGLQLLDAARAQPEDPARLESLLAHALGLGTVDQLLHALGFRHQGRAPVSDLGALSVIHLLHSKHDVRVPPNPDWKALHTQLRGLLRRPPGSDAALVVAGSHALIAFAPEPERYAFVETLPHVASQWLPLVLLALPWFVAEAGQTVNAALREERLAFAAMHEDLDPPMRRALVELHSPFRKRVEIGSEPLIAAASHSRLIALSICQTITALFSREGRWTAPSGLTDNRWNTAPLVLSRGGGSIRDVDYPAFSVTVGQGLPAAISDEHSKELLRLATAIADLAKGVKEGTECVARMIMGNLRARGHDVPRESADLTDMLRAHAAAYVYIRRFSADVGPRKRISKRAIRKVEEVPDAEQSYALRLRALHLEGLAHALLSRLQDPWPGLPVGGIAKEAVIHTLRTIALVYPMETAEAIGRDLTNLLRSTEDLEGDGRRLWIGRVTGHLAHFVYQGALELQWALGIPHAEALPRLLGGEYTPVERDARRLLRQLGQLPPGEQPDETITFKLAPLSRIEALGRGDLAADCSSRSVPLRALQPHHIYYGIAREGGPIRGYASVFEAWASTDDGQRRQPVLCLDSLNCPDDGLIGAELDVVAVLQAIARSRGLELALSLTDMTWNYGNYHRLELTRVWREGLQVQIAPADPVTWWLYQSLTAEAKHYTVIRTDRRPSDQSARLLQSIDPERDGLRPETVAEISRFSRLAPEPLRVTAWTRHGAAAGFITEWPGMGRR